MTENTTRLWTGDTVTTVALEHLLSNPHNPRAHLGDLSEFTRSIKAHGVLPPVVALAPDERGDRVLVAGHRRRAAAEAAGLEGLPVVLRAWAKPISSKSPWRRTPTSTISSSWTTVERLMSLYEGLTPAKLSKRIGKAQAWVRDRIAVTVLPALARTTLRGCPHTWGCHRGSVGCRSWPRAPRRRLRVVRRNVVARPETDRRELPARPPSC